ncbi:hypothetical protein YC2023_041131 [Brassica napus]
MEVIMKRIKFIKLRRMNMILKFDEVMKDGTFTIRGYVGGGEFLVVHMKPILNASNISNRKYKAHNAYVESTDITGPSDISYAHRSVETPTIEEIMVLFSAKLMGLSKGMRRIERNC